MNTIQPAVNTIQPARLVRPTPGQSSLIPVYLQIRGCTSVHTMPTYMRSLPRDRSSAVPNGPRGTVQIDGIVIGFKVRILEQLPVCQEVCLKSGVIHLALGRDDVCSVPGQLYAYLSSCLAYSSKYPRLTD